MNQINVGRLQYKNKLILENSTLKLSKNGICLINGINGSGKTTLARYLVKKNHILVSYMMQSNDALIKEYNILENISFNQIPKDTIINLLKELEFDYLINIDRVDKLSGGEKRVISLLRTLLSDAPIIILDEPTNDVDLKTKEKIILLIEKIAKYKYIIIITHISYFKNYNYKYIIEDKKLKLIAENLDNKNYNFKFNQRNLKKIYPEKKNLFLIILPLLFFIFVFNSLYNFNLEKYGSSKNNDSFRLMNYAASQADISDSFDTSLLKCLELKNTKKCLDNNIVINDITLHKNIIIQNDYDKFVLEYYDKEEKQYFNINDLIERDLSNNYKYNVELKYPIDQLLFNNKSNIIYLPNKFNDKKYIEKVSNLGFKIKYHDNKNIYVMFNKNLFRKYSDKYKNLYELDVLVKNNKNEYFIDFIIKNNLENTRLLLKNEDINKLFYELDQLVSVKSFIKKITIPYILIYIFIFLMIMFLEKAKMNNNRIIYNYGFEINKIYQRIKQKYLISFHYILLITFGGVIAYYTYLKFENYLLTITIITFVFTSLIASKLLCFLIKFNLKRMVK